MVGRGHFAKKFGQVIVPEELSHIVDRAIWKMAFLLYENDTPGGKRAVLRQDGAFSIDLYDKFRNWLEEVVVLFAKRLDFADPRKESPLYANAYTYLINSTILCKACLSRFDNEDTFGGPHPTGIDENEFADFLDVSVVIEAVECLLFVDRVTFKRPRDRERLITLLNQRLSTMPMQYWNQADKDLLLTDAEFWDDFFVFREEPITNMPDENPFELIMAFIQKYGGNDSGSIGTVLVKLLGG